MANRVGEVGSWNQTVGVKIEMDDMVDILSPDDTPSQSVFGTFPMAQVKTQWLNDELMAQTVTASGVTGSDPWTVTVAAGTASEVRPGDILHVQNSDNDDEQYVVSSVNTSTDTIVVAGFAGNTHAPATSDVLEIVGQYRNEGADPEEARSRERTEDYNYAQVYQEAVEATRTARKRGARDGLYGQGDPYAYELSKKFRELAIRFERTILFGQRAISNDAQKRSMGGLFFFIGDSGNAASVAKASASAGLKEVIREAWEDGGNPKLLMVSPAVKQALSDNIDPTLRRSSYQSRRGGYVVDTFLSDFGEVEIATNRWLPTKKGILVDVPRVGIGNFDPFFHELLAKTGDSDQGHIVGEKSLKVKELKAHGLLTITDAA